MNRKSKLNGCTEPTEREYVEFQNLIYTYVLKILYSLANDCLPSTRAAESLLKIGHNRLKEYQNHSHVPELSTVCRFVSVCLLFLYGNKMKISEQTQSLVKDLSKLILEKIEK